MLERGLCLSVPPGHPRDSYPLLLFLRLSFTFSHYVMIELTLSWGISDFPPTYSKIHTVSCGLGPYVAWSPIDSPIWCPTYPDPLFILHSVWLSCCFLNILNSLPPHGLCTFCSICLNTVRTNHFLPVDSSVTSSERPSMIPHLPQPPHTTACLYHLFDFLHCTCHCLKSLTYLFRM